jgi:PAS domain S-box-containing protein
VALVEYVDGDPVVRRVNAAFEETFGHPPARTVGASLNDLVVPDDDGTADDADARARAGEAVRRVVERETAAGDRREFLLRTAPADANGAGTLPARPPDDAADPGERGPLVYATYVDVAGAVPTRPTLDRYKPLAETLDDPVYLLDAEGRFQYVNRSFLDLVGYDRGEVLGAAPSLVKDDAAVERAEAELGRLLSDDGPDDVQFEVAIRPRTGDPIPCEDHMGVLPYDGERFRGSVGILRDIRDRKERERALRRRNERLDEFARVVSHDLRNPLSVARGRLDVARREVGDDADAHLESVDEAHGRMEELVEDLLELARGSGAVEDPDPVDLGATAGRCWDTVATATATLAVETDATVLAEESRLRQLLENLMRNAVEHGSTGSQNAERSGDVAERSSAGSRTESDDAVEHAGDDVTVEVGDLADGFYVADDGPGIPPDEHEAVFEPGHSTTDDGTGFGLAIAERVAEGHDWSLVATAADDGGARFEVRGVEFAD